jgi:SpoIID/LytB domain protein
MLSQMGASSTIPSILIRKLRLLLAIALLPALLVPGRAGADTTFTIYGSGWGHAVGLSQWGAYGLAAKGWTVNQILTQFFTGTTVGPTPWSPAKVRVGILQDRIGIGITAQGQPTNLRLGSTTGTQIAQIPVGHKWIVNTRSGQWWVKKPDGTYVGGKGYGDTTQSLFAVYAGSGGSVYLDQTGHTYARGWIEMNIYVPCTGCARRLRAIQVLGTQEYLYGVAEAPVDWGSTAQQVQAITSRGYALWLMKNLGQHRAVCNCGVWSTTRDQYYVGSDRELASYGAAWIAAVNATNGQVVLYGGALAQTNFFASSGGYTENSENVWGGTAYPYLRGVCDPGDYTTANPNRVWSVSMTGTAIGTKVKSYTGKDVGVVTGFTNIKRGVSGRLETITVVGGAGSVTLTGLGFRAALGLKDDRVWINKNMNVQGQIRATYDGLKCAPGLQKSPQNAEPGGAYQRFANGRIYLNGGKNKAYWLHGLVLTRYLDLGQWSSALGWPTSGVQTVDADHVKATFDNGTITCTISTSTCA